MKAGAVYIVWEVKQRETQAGSQVLAGVISCMNGHLQRWKGLRRNKFGVDVKDVVMCVV